MIVTVNDDVRIHMSGDKVPEFTIQKRRVVGQVDRRGRVPKNAGESVWDNVAYKGTLAQALVRCLDFTAASSQQQVTLLELVDHVQKWTERIEEAAQ